MSDIEYNDYLSKKEVIDCLEIVLGEMSDNIYTVGKLLGADYEDMEDGKTFLQSYTRSIITHLYGAESLPDWVVFGEK